MTSYPTRGVDAAEPLDFDRPRVTLSTTIAYRGRQLVVSAEGMDADRFCTMLDKRFGPASQSSANTVLGQDAAPPTCPVHRKPMREGKGGSWYCPSKVGDGWCKERA